MKSIIIFLLITFISSLALFANGVHPNGGGTEENPYRILTLDNLLWVSTNSASWDKYFIQIADIDAANTSTWNEGEGFIPIGNSSTKFSGDYNGNGHFISGLTINRDDFYQGLFGYTERPPVDYNKRIKNLDVINANIQGSNYVGALAGYSSLEINNCYSSGSVTVATFYGGGLVGYNQYPIRNSYSSCVVTGGSRLGGLVGKNDGSIYNCYSTGDIFGGDEIGGFVGRNSNYIENSFSRSNVHHTSVYYHDGLGGFCGYSENSSIALCYSTGIIDDNAQHPTDKGFLGEEGGDSNGYFGNFFDNELSNQQTDTIGAATPKSTVEMKTTSTFTDHWWDFVGESGNGDNDYWNINLDINDGYPYLTVFYDVPSLDAPQNLVVSILNNQVILEWDAVAGATSYKVYYSTSPYEVFQEDLSGVFDNESWTAPIENDSEKIFYKVIAFSS